ncbi:MAG: GTPase Era [candidate division WOR-3 bacterium]
MEHKCGYVAILGRPNVGKSTLLNALLNFKLSIVTPKPQTTRNKILGILNGDDYQIIFIDTPGILKPQYTLQRLMQKEITSAVSTADLFLIVVEPFSPPTEDEINLIKKVSSFPMILAINKIDCVDKPSILPIIDAYQKFPFREIHPISALNQDGIEDLKKSIVDNLPYAEPFYPKDQLSEKPERFFIAELIRETIFTNYGEEIPYSTIVEIEEVKEREVGKTYIRATIYVQKSTQRAIILGKDGSAIKKLGSNARKKIEQFLNKPVYLELLVKVKEDWRDNESFIKNILYKI